MVRDGPRGVNRRAYRLEPESTPPAIASSGNSVWPRPLATMCVSVMRLVAESVRFVCRDCRLHAAIAWSRKQ